MIESSLRILRTDISGMPIEWVGFEDAVKLHCLEQILYPMGSSLYVVRGGINARTGRRSTLEVYSIICTLGQSRAHLKNHSLYTPPLNNKALFRRVMLIYVFIAECSFPPRSYQEITCNLSVGEVGMFGRML